MPRAPRGKQFHAPHLRMSCVYHPLACNGERVRILWLSPKGFFSSNQPVPSAWLRMFQVLQYADIFISHFYKLFFNNMACVNVEKNYQSTNILSNQKIFSDKYEYFHLPVNKDMLLSEFNVCAHSVRIARMPSVFWELQHVYRYRLESRKSKRVDGVHIWIPFYSVRFVFWGI